MKKLICILATLLLVTGCTRGMEFSDVKLVEGSLTLEEGKQRRVYLREDTKELIEEINSLREKYKEKIVGHEGNFLYIDVYDDINNNRIGDFEFSNRYIPSQEYFDDLVQILDREMARGLKGYVEEMKLKQLKLNQPIIEKIGRTVIYSENRIGEEANYISIKMNFLDIEDEDYREVFNKIAQDKYVLNNIIIGDKRNLIEFGNSNSVYSGYDGSNLNIRYNMFFQDKDFKKVNILIQTKDKVDLEEEDMDVFINLVNSLKINGEEKGLLIKEYRDILKNKDDSKKLSIKDHNVFIKYKKGNIYGMNDWDMIYLSIEVNPDNVL